MLMGWCFVDEVVVLSVVVTMNSIPSVALAMLV
jgi:hypothetical protein